MKNRRLTWNRLTRLESLEERRLLAGNVTATLQGGTLFLRGDSLDNSVAVSQISTTQFAVAGLSTTVNGSSAPVLFNGTIGAIDADFREGNDLFGLSNSSADLLALATELQGGTAGTLTTGTTARTPVAGSVNVRMGAGNDAVAIIGQIGGSLTLDLGNGNDAVAVENSSIRKALVVEGDDGNDPIRVRNTEVGGLLLLNGGKGNDTLNTTNIRADEIVFNAGPGNDDSFVTNSRASHSLTVDSSDGDDDLEIRGSDVGGGVSINQGHGNDTASVANSSIRRDLTVILGSGNDSFGLRSPTPVTGSGALSTRSTVRGALLVDGGSGNDSVRIGESATGSSVTEVALNATLLGVGGVDSFFVGLARFERSLTIDSGNDNDAVQLSNATIARTLSVFLGSGDDTLEMASSSAAVAELFGGSGRDSIRLTGSTIGRTIRKEFEVTL